MDLLLNPATDDTLVTWNKTFQNDKELLQECTNSSTNNEEETVKVIADESEKIRTKQKSNLWSFAFDQMLFSLSRRW